MYCYQLPWFYLVQKMQDSKLKVKAQKGLTLKNALMEADSTETD
jgi:hypothetical protein